jgi:Predicted dithiol-disulfide isomerase involved in polyketide biosynthesis
MDQAQPVGRIDVISDVICPWCYIGKRQLERALDLLEQALRFTVAWHPFQLNPDMPREGVDRAQYRIAKFGSPSARASSTSASPRPPPRSGWTSISSG